MNDPKPQQEPSMEEILASIRRIISEDDTEEGGDAENAAAAAPEDQPAEGADEPDAPAEEPAAVAEETAPEPDMDAENDVLELTDEAPAEDVAEKIDFGDDGEAEPATAESPPDTPQVVAVDIDQTPGADPAEGLVSAPQVVETTDAFTNLASAVERDRMTTLAGIGGRTVEEVVKDVVRPLIKDWLDEHLPMLVERLVSREIDRMSRRAEDRVED